MKKKSFLLCWLFSIAIFSTAQKRDLEYLIKLKKGGSVVVNGSGTHLNSFFLKDPVTENFMMLSMGNKKTEYLLFNNNKKIRTNFSLDNVFKKKYSTQKQNEYLSGTAGLDKYHFVFKVKTTKGFGFNTNYQLLAVGPIRKTTTVNELFDIPREEKLIVSFGDFGQYFSVFVNDDAGELKLYGINASGKSFIKTVIIAVPVESKKKKLSDYRKGMQVIMQNEESGLEVTTEKVKIFHSPEKKLSIVINEKDEPTGIVNILATTARMKKPI